MDANQSMKQKTFLLQRVRHLCQVLPCVCLVQLCNHITIMIVDRIPILVISVSL
jgi:hypothetical protein